MENMGTRGVGEINRDIQDEQDFGFGISGCRFENQVSSI